MVNNMMNRAKNILDTASDQATDWLDDIQDNRWLRWAVTIAVLPFVAALMLADIVCGALDAMADLIFEW